MENLCANCGNLCYAVNKNKGSVGMEAILLLFSVLLSFVNLLFGLALLIVFVVYCIWRLSSKFKACPTCESTNLIPADSPMARNIISQMYKERHG